jgi:PAS domain S-box-containing protein
MHERTDTSCPHKPSGDISQFFSTGSGGCVLFVLTNDGRIAAWSDAARRLMGYDQQDILGRAFTLFFFRPEEVQRNELEMELETAVSTGFVFGGRWYVRQDGTAFWGEGALVPVRDHSGVLRGFARLVCDRSDEKLARKAVTPPSMSPQDLLKIVESGRDFLLGCLGSPESAA